jgi:hypothetical protein
MSAGSARLNPEAFLVHRPRIEIRPGVINKKLWFPTRPPEDKWARLRKAVLTRDDYTCAGCDHRALKGMMVHHLERGDDDSLDNLTTICGACHAVLHIGLSLMRKYIEIWEVQLDQVAIIQRTRDGIRGGLSLASIKASLPLTQAPLPPNAVTWANNLVRTMGSAPRASLAEPLCAVFVDFRDWQLDLAS